MLYASRGEIQRHIQGWLAQEENLEIVSSGDDMRHGYFFSWRVQVTELISCDVSIENDAERVIITIQATFPLEEIAAKRIRVDYRNLVDGLRFNLEQRGLEVQVVAIPDFEHPASLEFSRVIHFSELSRDGLISAIYNEIEAVDISRDLLTKFYTFG